MAKRQNKLVTILINNGIKLKYPVIIDRKIFSQSKHHKEIINVYKSLGCQLNEYPINFGNFDMIGKDFFNELYEENHFNTYRKTILQSSVYNNFKYFLLTDYKNYCDCYGIKGRQTGNFWTIRGSEKLFSKYLPEKAFSGHRSARWKQRAFYDFLKDVYGIIAIRPVFRFSIYERINGVPLNTILNDQKHIVDFINHISNRLSRK